MKKKIIEKSILKNLYKIKREKEKDIIPVILRSLS